MTMADHGSMIQELRLQVQAQAALLAAFQERIDEQQKLTDEQQEQIDELCDNLFQKQEKHYQKVLERHSQAGHLRIREVGETVITSATAHIEIKQWSLYHVVPEQLEKYQQAAPRRDLIVYFFGKQPVPGRLDRILRLMFTHKIRVYSFGCRDEILDHNVEQNTDTLDGSPDLVAFSKFISVKTERNQASKMHVHRVKELYRESLGLSEKDGPSTSAVRKMLLGLGYTAGKDGKMKGCSCSVNTSTGFVHGLRIKAHS